LHRLLREFFDPLGFFKGAGVLVVNPRPTQQLLLLSRGEFSTGAVCSLILGKKEGLILGAWKLPRERPGMATFLIKFLLAVSTLLYRPCPRCLSLMA